MLFDHFQKIILSWQEAFGQKRTALHGLKLAIGLLCTLGRRTISRSIFFFGQQHKDWSADYCLFSRAKWDPEQLFQPILEQSLPFCKTSYLSIAFDDTKLHKTGRKIKTASYQRDPLSPAFHVNLCYGLRFLQASLLIPLYDRDSRMPPRGFPVRFQEVPAVKKPGKRATDEQRKAYLQQKKEHNLPLEFVKMLHGVRASADQAGASDRLIIATVDGSFCNRTVFQNRVSGTVIVARTRKDTRLCFPAEKPGRRVYGREKFSPHQVRSDEKIPWKEAKIFHGGAFRDIRYKEVNYVLWQSGAKTLPLRLIVVAPTPYWLSKKSCKLYRQVAYLLTTDTKLPIQDLIQEYFNRWQIEVNHRDEKDLLGVGQAQVRSDLSVPRQPAFVVAAYSALLLASVMAYGPGRTDEYEPLPKWRRNAVRPSILDLLTLLRKQYVQNQMNVSRAQLQQPQMDMIWGACA